MPPLNIIWWVIFIIWLFSGMFNDSPDYPWFRPGRHFIEGVLLAILAIAVFGK